MMVICVDPRGWPTNKDKKMTIRPMLRGACMRTGVCVGCMDECSLCSRGGAGYTARVSFAVLVPWGASWVGKNERGGVAWRGVACVRARVGGSCCCCTLTESLFRGGRLGMGGLLGEVCVVVEGHWLLAGGFCECDAESTRGFGRGFLEATQDGRRSVFCRRSAVCLLCCASGVVR